MTFEPALPEEVRGDQFETATPAYFGEVGVDEREGLSATPFYYVAVQIPTDGTPSDAVTQLPDTDPDVGTVPEIDANLVPDVFTDENRVKSPEMGDETSMRTATIIPHTSVSSPAPTTAPGSAFRGTPEPGADEGAPCGDTEDSCGGDEASADDVPPTPAVDTLSSIRTDETEIGSAELSTFVPDTPAQEPTTRPQTDNEGSASGEDEASGQDLDPAETPRLPSTPPPLHSQQPPLVASARVTGVPVVFPHVDSVTDAGSGAEQLPRQEEGPGEKGSRTDLPREINVTLLPDVEAVTSETSTREYPTQSSFVSLDDKKHPFMEHASTTAPASQLYSLQADRLTTTLKPRRSQATPSSLGHSADVVPQEAFTSEPTSTGHVHREMLPPLLESQTLIPQETNATKQPERGADVSLEASTVNIQGARTKLASQFEPFSVALITLELTWSSLFA